jgi:hypothetical protein
MQREFSGLSGSSRTAGSGAATLSKHGVQTFAPLLTGSPHNPHSCLLLVFIIEASIVRIIEGSVCIEQL